VPTGQVGMESRRRKKWSMLNGWDSGIQVREGKGLLGVDYKHGVRVVRVVWNGTVTILMSHGYCINLGKLMIVRADF